jgi:hypothetical protein
MRDKEVYVLRNLSRGRGVGFFEDAGFYPDFILWVLDTGTKRQRIVFVESHGMLHAPAAHLWERLRELAPKGCSDVEPDAFIVSVTPFDDLSRRYESGTWNREKFAEKHILFPERNSDYDYIRMILQPSEGPGGPR